MESKSFTVRIIQNPWYLRFGFWRTFFPRKISDWEKKQHGRHLGKTSPNKNYNTPSGKLTYSQGKSTFCPGIYHQNLVDFLAIAMLVDQSVLPVGSRQIKRFGSRAWLKLLKPKLRSEVRRLESGKGFSKESSRNPCLLHSLEWEGRSITNLFGCLDGDRQWLNPY